MNNIDICNELKQNFIDFAYEANSQRAFPDARDGLKPGQRACLWEFFVKGYTSNKPHVKSAKISGGVIATWWPHGDVAIYETFARMSQPWVNNIPEVDWHGSNGNIVIGSSPASSRYTEARLNKAIEEGMFGGVKKNNVPMILNFSEDEEWPEVLPALFPRLMVNGSQGIGVTVAQTWLPHNLNDLIQIIKTYIQDGKLDYSNLAPDFPTGGIIINKNELSNIYSTGKGKAVVRAVTEIKDNIIKITELPYQVYVEPLIEEIKTLIEKDEITGIENIYNKTDKSRLLIEIECNAAPKAVLNKLFSTTSLQKSFSANQFALVGKTPTMLNLQNYLDLYIKHNIECLIKEFKFDYEKAKNRLEIVDGLVKALENIDNIITLIKKSESAAAARQNLMNEYKFTELQAKAIVDMRLGKLAHLEYVELNTERAELIKTLEYCNSIIENPLEQKAEFLKRLMEFNNRYSTPRRTQVTQVTITKEEKEVEVIEPEKCVVVMTEGGLIKRVPASSFKVQRRNGKGIRTQDDITSAVIRTNTVDSLMVFTSQGKMYRLVVNDIPVGTNTSKGVSIQSLVNMEINEQPAVIYSIYKDTDAKYVVFVTKNGMIKKTALEEYIQTKKKTGILAINIRDNDELASVFLAKDEDIIILTEMGYGIRINSKEIGATSRATYGVKAIGLKDQDAVSLALPVHDTSDELAIFLNNGLGKKFSLTELPAQKRGGRGLCCTKINSPDTYLTAAALVSEEDNVLIVGNTSSVYISAKEIPTLGRASSGNLMIKNNKIVSVSKV
jgi:DNA gyrase subunit A